VVEVGSPLLFVVSGQPLGYWEVAVGRHLARLEEGVIMPSFWMNWYNDIAEIKWVFHFARKARTHGGLTAWCIWL
jgi:hypothetical protein